MNDEKRKDAFFCFIYEIAKGVIMASMLDTRTSVHFKDSLLTTFNLLNFRYLKDLLRCTKLKC